MIPIVRRVYDWSKNKTVVTLAQLSTALGTSGTASSATFLRGDNSWAAASGGGGGDAVTSGTLAQFAPTTSAQLLGVITDETGTGAVVFAASPTLVTPALGTPASGILTNCTGLPVAGITPSTSTAFGAGTVELGHASDTTISRASAGVLAVEGVNVLMNGGALGTPASGTLTSCTGLPVAGLTSSTSTALGVGTVELGHASDTTLSRSAAGQVAVEGVDVLTTSNTKTVTNKRITPRPGSTASSATPTINTDDVDAYSITALAAAITSMTTNLTGTPTNFQRLLIRIKDDGTARAITWGASFEAGSVALPTTTVLGKTLLAGFIYDSVDSKWACEAAGSRP